MEYSTKPTKSIIMKRLLFFCALMGIFLSVDAGPRLDVDVGDQVSIENVYENPEINTIQAPYLEQMTFAEIGNLGAENPGELSYYSVNEDQGGYKLYKGIPDGPGADMQCMSYEMDELTVKAKEITRTMAMVYHKRYQPLLQGRNDLKRKGVEI